MHNLTKGALAAGAATILLAGGAGTLAYWNDSQEVDAGTISTGLLNLLTVPTDDGTWTDVTEGGNAPISDIAAFNIVPGDSLTYSRTFTVEAEGDNLVAELSTSDITPPGSDLAPYITTDVTTSGTAVPGQVTSADDGATITVLVTVDFDPATPGKAENGGVNAGDDDTLDLSDLTVNLEQVQGPANGN